MHDLRYIREHPEEFDAAMQRRGAEAVSARLLKADAARRAAQTAFQEMQERRNALSREIGKVKKEGGDADAVMAEVHGLKDGIAGEEAKERDQASVLQAILQELPNIAAEDVPDGLDENDNGAMSRLVARLEQVVRETGAGLLYLHHTSNARGSHQLGRASQAGAGAGLWSDRCPCCPG